MGLSSLLGAACSSNDTTPPPLPPCTASSGGQVALPVAAYTAVDPIQTMGCAVFPPNPVAAVEYLVVPQSASGTPNDSQAFKLGGSFLAAPPAPGAPLARGTAASAAVAFDVHLRLAERELSAQVPGPLRAPPRV